MSIATAGYQVTDEQVAHYRDQGYLVIEGLIGPDEIADLRTDILKLARGGYPCPNLDPLPAGIDDDEALSRVLCLHQPHRISPVIRHFCEHPSIAAVLAKVVAAHLPADWWDGSVKCMQSMFFAKGPGKPGQAWHQDEIYIPTRDRSLAGAWIAVDDANIDNGCLWVLPGSHRRGVLYEQRDHNSEHFDSAQESFGFDDSDEVPVEVPAGSVVFFNGYLLHRSKPNHTRDRYRRALVNHYMSSASLLPWSSDQNGVGIARSDCRAVFQVAGEDPYAAKGYVEDINEVHLRAEGSAH
ncbi:MAG: phytanoyl-CoA dioxygenase family protein [Planctomycetota bacterium]|jgi:phytanoyl-CoA hydroxylase|nr:phytanoyl-CoA dioxygenase family protein [Planctomycetota bacterium]